MTEFSTVDYPAVRSCPFAEPVEHTRLREQQPITKVPLTGGGEAWWVARHAEGRAILADARFSKDRSRPNYPMPGFDEAMRKQFRMQPPSMNSMDGSAHAAERRAVLGEFTVKRLTALRPRIQKIVDERIDAMLAAETRPLDLVPTLSLPVPSLVISELLGVPYSDHEFFESRTMTMVSGNSSAEGRSNAMKELTGYLGELVLEKASEPCDDLLSRLIERRRQEGDLDLQALLGMAFLLLGAGHETTANMISLGVIALLEHPAQLAMIKADPGRTPAAVEELLRYCTIVDLGGTRVATEDVAIGGVTIPADDGVIVSLLSANRDPEPFPNADALDIDRGGRHHLAFGFGPHQCLGQNLARLELQIVFDTLFRRIPALRLAVPMNEIPFKSDAPIFYGAYSLPVTW
uniref:cytochrome P450 n=1 Tax=Paractinoplanes polyasparticus TaxID=2856853 RepID=UPI001C8515A9|nr:cytochrome P450 [Actinoplanes polyasparticus]